MGFNYLREKVENYSPFGLILSMGTVLGLCFYSVFWESKQPQYHLERSEIHSIKPYVIYNDLHLFSQWKKLRIEGEEKEIHIPQSNWDSQIKKGDLVDLTVKEMFSLTKPKLLGLKIEKSL